MWVLLGLGVVGAGAAVYFATRPAAPAPTTVNPSTGQPITAAQQAQLNAQIAQANAAVAAQMGTLLNEGAQQNAAADTSGDTTTSNIPSTGNPDVDNAVNQAASQLGF